LWERHQAYEDASAAGWWYPHKDFAMVCNHPAELHLDDQGRLHSEAGAAISWNDGWGLHVWHGVRVPAKVIEQPDQLTADEILGEQNVEVRRAMIEKAGPERLLEKGKLLQHDSYGHLWEIPVAGDEPIRLVEVEDPSTGREYYLRVPPSVGSARAAVAWTFDVPEREYEPAVEA
jgi:hypothetical protein